MRLRPLESRGADRLAEPAPWRPRGRLGVWEGNAADCSRQLRDDENDSEFPKVARDFAPADPSAS